LIPCAKIKVKEAAYRVDAGFLGRCDHTMRIFNLHGRLYGGQRRFHMQVI
jgi:hypothetical protein